MDSTLTSSAVIPQEIRLELTDFLNLFPQRGHHLMWLLGAGASVGAGLPSGTTLTWEFKRALYCNAQRLPPSRFPDLNDSIFQEFVQSYFDSRSGFPPLGHDEEYSAYFEAYLPDERDRRRFLDGRLQGCKPSYGHYCFAALMSLGQIRLAWTTNFDQLIEKACSYPAIAEKSARSLAVAGLEQPDKVSDLIRDEAWPLLVKLHGDFLYRKLKNTTPELKTQDETLRHCLAEECGRRGLAVIGYSGRDASVMSALTETLQTKEPFSHGLFWFVRPGEQPNPAVLNLIIRVHEAGAQAAFVEVNTFDELMADLFLPYQDSLAKIRDLVKEARPKRQAIPIIYTTRVTWPVLRTNALHITEYPATCTIFEAKVGKTKEVKALTLPHSAEMVAFRRKAGVIAFGIRTRLTEVFSQFDPKAFDRYSIEERRLHYDCPELGLLYHALVQGIANKTGLLRSMNAKGRFLFAENPQTFTAEELAVFGRLKSKGVWMLRPKVFLHEGFELFLDFRDGRFWMLLDPTILVTADGRAPYQGADRSEIAREPLVTRYNRQRNDALQLWIGFLQRHCGTPLKVTFPSDAQCEAEFTISIVSAYSRKA
ncbi:MAG: SIR2 family protein [Chloroflexi bacterium]|nr:SIR2 family protein [Chloroflexota bacterium]